jgi:hypothetical protein
LFNRPKCSSGRRASGFVLVTQRLVILEATRLPLGRKTLDLYRTRPGSDLVLLCGFRRRRTVFPKEAEQHFGLKANAIGDI